MDVEQTRPLPDDSSPETTDSELVARVLAGEKETFSLLIKKYWKMVSVLCYQRTRNFVDAEDLAQEAFVKSYSALASLRDPNRFGAWLYNISTKVCIDWMRRRGRQISAISLDDLATKSREPAAPDSQDDEVEVRDLHNRVLKAVSALPERYALVLTLRYVKRMTYREIAEHLSEPSGTISNRIHRASEMLRRALESEGAQPRAGSGRHRRVSSRQAPPMKARGEGNPGPEPDGESGSDDSLSAASPSNPDRGPDTGEGSGGGTGQQDGRPDDLATPSSRPAWLAHGEAP